MTDLVLPIAIGWALVIVMMWVGNRFDPDVERLRRNRKERADINEALRREVK